MIRLIGFLLIFIIAGCYKTSPLPERHSIGYFEAILNGKVWSRTYLNAYQTVESALVPFSASLPCTDDHLEIFSELYSPEGYLRQKFHLMKIPQKAGKYDIIPSTPYHCDEQDPVYAELYTITQDGDVVGDVYTTLKGSDSYLEIEKYNQVTGETKGTFKLTMVVEKRGGEPALPDTLYFTDGKFHTKFSTP
ncbi:hypothetical protein [Dyadobacter sp. CY343]|uniref:hypothetical protein n=1 Tax=Dyadobacter sp. CY343 TaxID=2907299 RepID=UPI001F24123B|nr:hypothetical protein [Dyadobacter sp. CY343]MCE7062653.1 hypothetical protein [Dyadobacter sp. CY343]